MSIEDIENAEKSCIVTGAKAPFIALIRRTGERLQFSYPSINHALVPMYGGDAETCFIYAAGFEIVIKGQGMQILADLLLDCKVKKIRQNDMPHTLKDGGEITLTSLAWKAIGIPSAYETSSPE